MVSEIWHQFSASGVGFLAGVGTGFLLWGRPGFLVRNKKKGEHENG